MRDRFLLRSGVGLHNPNFLLRQSVEFIHKLVDLAVSGFNFALKLDFAVRVIR